MKRTLLTLFTLFAFQALLFGQQEAKPGTGKNVSILLYDDGTWRYADSVPQYTNNSTSITGLEIPQTNPKDNIVSHTGYSLLFNNKHKQANWVAYELTSAETNKQFERTNKFLPDPAVTSGTANDNDYKGSGYDKGHLAPAADMGWSSTAMAESFYYSNMSPQTPGFNRGIWKRLEELVRIWAIEYNSVYIVTGPVLTNGLPSIGANKVSIPKYYYKVILDYTEPGIKGIGFIIPNTNSNKPLYNYAVTIDSVEKYTGIDFYPALPEKQEKLIESTICLKCWSWKSVKSESNAKSTPSTFVQCKGNTKVGASCNNKTLSASGYCQLHVNQQQNITRCPIIPVKTKMKSISVQ
ncbi:MAG: DNA/RNA non-specific endonuclease [Bacteroidota bacterium]